MGFRVLIVDDSPAMRSVIRRVIVLSGFALEECLEAGHGGEACQMLRERPVDVILTDINMPVMNGEQFLNSIRGDKSFEGIPVVVVSTDATENRIRRMLELGAQGYITKPFFPESLRGELERVLGGTNA
jgi:two-component system chemotaxis response regulator CheY